MTRAYRGASPEQRLDERRQRLLAAALELFSSLGYAKTSIEALCGAAKVTARHFYQLFPSREALLAALYEDIIRELRAAVLGAVSAPGLTGAERVALAVRALVRHYLEDARRARIGVLEVVGVSTAIEAQRRAVIHDIARIIEAFLQGLAERGELPQRSYHLVAIALVGGINELLADWLTAANPPSLTDLSQEIVYVFEALIAGARSLRLSPSLAV